MHMLCICTWHVVHIACRAYSMSCIFYSARAGATGSEWGVGQIRPFALSFVLCVGYMLLELLVLRCVLRRRVSDEDSGAGEHVYACRVHMRAGCMCMPHTCVCVYICTCR